MIGTCFVPEKQQRASRASYPWLMVVLMSVTQMTSGYDVRQYDDADAAGIPDSRRHSLGAMRRPIRSHTWRCRSALARDIRGFCQPRPAACCAVQRPVVVVGREHPLAVDDHSAELRALEAEYGDAAVRADVRKTIGDVGTAFVMAGFDANLLIMRASSGTHSDQ